MQIFINCKWDKKYPDVRQAANEISLIKLVKFFSSKILVAEDRSMWLTLHILMEIACHPLWFLKRRCHLFVTKDIKIELLQQYITFKSNFLSVFWTYKKQVRNSDSFRVYDIINQTIQLFCYAILKNIFI